MVALILLFAFSIGTATFIENDFGTEAAKELIYSATWFELLLFLLFVNLIGNINKFKLFQLKKWSVFLFHISFIMILLGAAITRYVSYEGMMHIREGSSSSKLLTSETYIQVKVDDKKQQYTYNKPLHLNPLFNKEFNHEFDFEGKQIEITSEGFYKSAEYFVEEDNVSGTEILEMVTSNDKGRMTQYLKKGETIYIGQLPVSFASTDASHVSFSIIETDSGLVFKTPFAVKYLSMDDRSTAVLSPDTVHAFKSRFLYTIQGINIVLKGHHFNSIVNVKQGKGDSQLDAIKFNVEVNGEKQTVMVQGGKGFTSSPTVFSLGGLNFQLGFGSKYLQLPFSISLTDFQLERYPGSNSPASFASEVVLIDKENNVEEEHRIYMNNVLDYRGFRFFQSSYDKDERGTVLSVNHDALGTGVTYLGYLMMAIGMFFTLFKKNTRYHFLNKKLKNLNKASIVIIGLMLGSSFYSYAQDHQHQIDTTAALDISKAHAEKFAYILTQDRGGRIKPVHTVASEVLRKLTRKEEFAGLNAEQVLLSMMAFPLYWQNKPMIKVSHPDLKKLLGIEGKYVDMNSMFDGSRYILTEKVEEINRKKASDRSKFDKDVMAVDERVNIAYLIYTGSMLNLFPDANSKNNDWYSASASPFPFRGDDSLFVRNIIPMYLAAVQESIQLRDWAKADEVLSYIDRYQKRFGKDVIPPFKRIDMEVSYNKLNIFKKLFQFYGLFGFLLLLLLFIDLFKGSLISRHLALFIKWLFIIAIAAHTTGLGMRWYISDHAPWSNAYESMIFIAWATMVAGFIFSQKSSITLAVTAILASLILMVAHLNWMDPEITNLVPVLNSYWLMIHVAIITASYGFLGLGSLLAFLNLILMIFRTKGNKSKVNSTLTELTIINEMTIQVGLFLLTIGTFLGGVWANESWGRYWGWDAKETWALVTVLVYVFVLHMRFIPKLKNSFAFNTAALLGFSSVIMTYFGVNYYLSGLHSYAAGDPVPIPVFVYYTIGIVFTVILLAYFRNKRSLTV